MVPSARPRNKIRPPRRTINPDNDQIEFEPLWNVLKTSLHGINSKNASKLSYEELYRTAYKLVLKKEAPVLYEKVIDFERDWLLTEVQSRIHCLLADNSFILNASDASPNERRVAGEALLRGLKEAWDNHLLCMNMTTDVLMYLDRVYLTDIHKPSIFTATLKLFRDIILRSPLSTEEINNITVEDILHSIILDQVRLEREGDIIDRHLVRSCVYIMEGLYETELENEKDKIYLCSFEPKYLQASKEFYRNEGQKLLGYADASTYLRHARKRLDEEHNRCISTLSELTSKKISKVVEDAIIVGRVAEVMDIEGTGFKHMINNDRYEDLGLLYYLISRVDPAKTDLVKGLKNVVAALGGDVNASALAAMTAPSQERNPSGEKTGNLPTQSLAAMPAFTWVEGVIRLKDKFDVILVNSFGHDRFLESALSTSFSTFINMFPRSAEFISLFIDENIKKGAKGKTEAEVDAELDKAIVLLNYISDKDLFETHYKKHLSRRLINGRSVSEDVEKQMIQKMKSAIGHHYTQKFEGMFKDIAVSKELTGLFKNHISNIKEAGKDKTPALDVKVLSTGMWPLNAGSIFGDDEVPISTVFPPEVEAAKKSFEKFYLARHNGRKLAWQASKGTADVRVTFPKVAGETEGKLSKERRHDFNMPTYSMQILSLFEDLPIGESISFEEIQARTFIPAEDLILNLQSISLVPKTQILKKHPIVKNYKSIKPTDRFSFNERFKSEFLRLKVGVIARRIEGTKEKVETDQRLGLERGGEIDAAVVRILKQRKTITHTNLMQEVFSQLTSRFHPDAAMVKKRIESLIDKEYLARKEDADTPSYVYLA